MLNERRIEIQIFLSAKKHDHTNWYVSDIGHFGIHGRW